MVTKNKSTDKKEAKKGRVKIDKMKLNKETVKDLTSGEEKMVRGGAAPRENANLTGPTCTSCRC